VLEDAKGKVSASEKQRAVIALLRDDLATPSALALLWETLRDDEIPPAEKLGVLTSAEEVLGLSLLTPPNSIPAEIPEDIVALAHERDAARESKDYARSDELRIHIQDRGYRVDDGPSGTVVTPSSH
jgi:cysteinyl-tRNA synthetase